MKRCRSSLTWTVLMLLLLTLACSDGHSNLYANNSAECPVPENVGQAGELEDRAINATVADVFYDYDGSTSTTASEDLGAANFNASGSLAEEEETLDEVSEDAVISEIRVYMDGEVAWATSYRPENVAQPTPTLSSSSTQQGLIPQPYRHPEAEDEVGEQLEEAAELKRREHEGGGGGASDWRPNSQSADTAAFLNESAPVNSSQKPPLHQDDDEMARTSRAERLDRNSRVIDFDPVPFGDRYQLQELGLADGTFLFTYLGQFLSFIQPYDFPVEFVRDLLWSRVSVVSLIVQSLRFEAGFVACVTVGLLFSLVIPSFALASTCSSICVPDKGKMADSISSIESVNCSRKAYVCVLFVLVAFIGTGVVALLVTNEQLSSAMLSSPHVLSSSLNDAGTYIRNTHRQISHVTMSAFDKTLTYLHADLQDVEELLGKPIQSQVAAETGVDVALDALVDVAVVSDDLSVKVAELQEGNLKMRGMMAETRDRLADLRAQVDALRRACPSRDRPLCDTIESAGLEIVLRTDQLNTDPRLAILRAMSGGDLSVLAKRVRSRFSDIPSDITRSTDRIRADIRRELDIQRSAIDVSLWPLETLARDLRSRVNEARSVADHVESAVDSIEQWRWLSLLFTGFLVLIIWCLLAVAIVYSCCDKEGAARALLIASLIVSSILSLVLWTIALSIMLVGGHGEVFACRPLYDQPQYNSLSQLLDDPGVLLKRSGGFFRNLVPRNYTLQVPVRGVLVDCEGNKPAYQAFQMDRILNVEATSDLKSWGNVLNFINNLNGNFTQLNFLDPELQEKLHSLLQATAVNMTALRSQVSRSLMGRDLASFAKQLDSVANQIKDLSTAARVETLASRTKRLITTNVQPIEEKKEELVYRVTALEVQIAPLQRQVNQSLSHLKTIQYYIDNQGSNISQMKASEYTHRLAGYLQQYREQLLSQLHHSVGLCRPLFDVFHGLRHHICRQIMDPLNGYWFALVWCLFWLAVATPVCLRLIHYYGLQKEGLLDNGGSLNSGERGPIWTTPGEDINADRNNW